MPEYKLTAEPPLAGRAQDFGALKISAPADLALVSVALPLGQEADAQKALTAAYGAQLPEPGRYALSSDGAARLIRMSPDQGLIAFTRATPDAEIHVAEQLNGALYTTDQTDVWTAIAIEGPGARAALERICPLNLHPDVFASDAAHRTAMEHLSVLILRTGEDGFLLLSASSSAESFWHAVQISARNAA